ncbi:aldehyde dehydrogenase family protein [Bacillus sp. Marseille-P3661]|uniref:aldehyde dehydrogenase family protein n=1 Tax=Bacillus sp. Marseille-P3661 TaxID=1936234 RepID=UPI0015E191EB|nr:aldehyde dehydrogenase family protein [Bacillus sp. Marseille-P3661]
MKVMPLTEDMFINGKVVSAEDKMKLYNPAQLDEVVGEITMGTKEHVDQAVEAAYEAWGDWSQYAPEKRASYLKSTANYIEQNLESLTELLVLENGKLLSEARSELLAAANVLKYYSGLANELDKEEVIENEQGKMILTRQPMGVVSIIVPWNYPVLLGFMMASPALLAGNTVVLKPSTYSPLTLTRILHHMAGELPKGALNVVLGSGSKVGSAMTAHEKVRKITFTGSTEIGSEIIAEAAKTIKNFSMELGGNDAAIILSDKNIDDDLINRMIKGVFTYSGQICYAIKRIYVSKDNYDEFVSKFTAAADRLRVGPGLNSESTLGPINNKAQLDVIQQLLEKVEKTNAKVTTVGQFVEGVSADQGNYILPRVITNVTNDDDIVKKEQFGPIIPIVPFETEEEAIAFANDTEFGLGNSVWTSDEEKGFELARKLQSGSVFVNIHQVGASAVNMPFGGFKQSGIGRGHGVEGLYEHTELQALIRRTDM